MKSMVTCPICGEKHSTLIGRFDPVMDQPLIDLLREEVPGWQTEQGACSRCLDQAQIELMQECYIGNGSAGEVNGFKILPIPLRLEADTRYTGKGITICVIDSGFFLHPDLIQKSRRILHIQDITRPESKEVDFTMPQGNAWHGTMTSVVAAGDGYLSHGQYSSLAPEANLVLLKVTNAEGVITGENIVKAIQWAMDHAAQYNIRIINLSITDDESNSFLENEVDLAVGRAVEKGLVVIAASGNDPQAPLKAPATAPHAITVGGLNDRNTLNPLTNTLYHSTYGVTVDKIQKPDIIAPAIWLPAPILPGTREHREAAALFELTQAGDSSLRAMLANHISKTTLSLNLLDASLEEIRRSIHQRIGETKFISRHYQHVDGTSFAAPLVCSVIAQMLEANPALDPATVREILLVTAKRLAAASADRQGWGVLSPRHAVEMASGKALTPSVGVMPVVDYKRSMIDFYFHHPEARKVVLTGDFVKWSTRGIALERTGQPDQWMASVPFTMKGVFRYKYVLNDHVWMSDPRNFFREPDGFNDFNSRIILN